MEIYLMKDKFACALDCMDGRTTDAVSNYLRKNYGVRWVDGVGIEPGINKILAENSDIAVIERIKFKMGISVHKHGAIIAAIVAHPECAGNPATEAEQIEQLKDAKAVVESFGFDIDIVLLWVEADWTTVRKIDHNLVAV